MQTSFDGALQLQTSVCWVTAWSARGTSAFAPSREGQTLQFCFWTILVTLAFAFEGQEKMLNSIAYLLRRTKQNW